MSGPKISPERVLFVVDHLGHGGVQEFILNYCRRIPEHRSTVIGLSTFDVYSDRLADAGATVFRFGALGVSSAPRETALPALLRPWEWISALLRLRWHLSRHLTKFDRVYLHCPRSFACGVLLRSFRHPHVFPVVPANRAQFSRLQQKIYGMFLRRFAGVFIPHSMWEEYRYARIPDENLLPQRWFVTRRDPARCGPRPFPVTLLSVGRAIRQKGHHHAIAVAAALERLVPGRFGLVIVGDGPDLAWLKARAAELGTSNVQFAGAVTDLDPLFAAADVILKMAEGEGINSAAREALLSGKLLAATLHTPQCRELAALGVLLPLDSSDPGKSARDIAGSLETWDAHKTGQVRAEAEKRWGDAHVMRAYAANPAARRPLSAQP